MLRCHLCVEWNSDDVIKRATLPWTKTSRFLWGNINSFLGEQWITDHSKQSEFYLIDLRFSTGFRYRILSILLWYLRRKNQKFCCHHASRNSELFRIKYFWLQPTHRPWLLNSETKTKHKSHFFSSWNKNKLEVETIEKKIDAYIWKNQSFRGAMLI